MSVKIIVDSTCDFEAPEREALGLYMIPLTVTIGENTYRDGIDISKEEFFRQLRASKTLTHTSQINPSTFLEKYEELGADCSELLVLTISQNLSGTYQSACIAAEQYTGKIRVVDRSLATTAFAMMVSGSTCIPSRMTGAQLTTTPATASLWKTTSSTE